MYGTYETIDGKPAVRFERVYPHPVEHVWRTSPSPSEMASWFPTTVEVDLREGGAMTFTFPDERDGADGRPRARARPAAHVRVPVGRRGAALRARGEGDGCRLTLTHLISNADEAARNAAGWHVCLDKLGGEESDWEPLYEEYERRGVPAGAEIPGR